MRLSAPEVHRRLFLVGSTLAKNWPEIVQIYNTPIHHLAHAVLLGLGGGGGGGDGGSLLDLSSIFEKTRYQEQDE